jgi:hypothetical protein
MGAGLQRFNDSAVFGKIPIFRHSRESGSLENIENTGFLLPQE